MDELEEIGSCSAWRSGRGIVRYEPVGTGRGHHHHLVCDSCGRLQPFSDEGLERAISRVSERLAAARLRARDRPARRLRDCAAARRALQALGQSPLRFVRQRLAGRRRVVGISCGTVTRR